MDETSLITREMHDAVGTEWAPFVIQIDRWLVKLFVEATGDGNPLYSDNEFAKKTRFGGTIVPPSLFAAALMRGEQARLPFQIPLKRILDGGSDFEFLKPVRIGDILTTKTKLVDIRQREGKVGKMLFLIFETTWTNQRNEVVTISRGIRVCY